jgi:hypothetical protein
MSNSWTVSVDTVRAHSCKRELSVVHKYGGTILVALGPYSDSFTKKQMRLAVNICKLLNEIEEE